MTSIVVAEDDTVRVLGLSVPSSHRARGVTRVEVAELVQSGHALSVDLEVPARPPEDTVALWLGDSFNRSAVEIELPPPPLPTSPMPASGGRFFIGSAAVLHPYLERWTVRAFQRFRAEKSAAIRRRVAHLMRWVLPDRPESLAAAWSTAENQRRELEMQIRSFARGRTADETRAAHEKLLNGPNDDLSRLRLVVFTGGTGVRREDVARRFAEQFDLHLATFRSPIERHIATASAHTDAKEKKRLMMELGQREVDQSPLALALSVLADAAGNNILVVDGLRHSIIRDTFAWLQPRKVVVVAVTADETEMRKRVVDSGWDPEQLFRHATERDIPKLAKDAHRNVGETVDGPALREIFDLAHA